MSWIVLFCSVHCNKIMQTRCLNRYFFTVLEARSLWSREPASLISNEGSSWLAFLPCPRMTFPLCMWGEGERFLVALPLLYRHQFYEIRALPFSFTCLPPKDPLCKESHCGLGLQHEFWWYTIQSIAWLRVTLI